MFLVKVREYTEYKDFGIKAQEVIDHGSYTESSFKMESEAGIATIIGNATMALQPGKSVTIIIERTK